MNRLVLRLGLIVVAVAVLGLTGWGALLVFVQGRSAAHAQSLRVELALERLRREAPLATDPGSAQTILERAIQGLGVAAAWESPGGALLTQGHLPPPTAWPPGAGRIVTGGQLVRTIELTQGPYARAIVAADLSPAQELSWLWSAMLAVTGVMVAAGLLLLRRAVAQPLARVTELVVAADVDGLQSLGGLSPDPFARLGRGVAAMNRLINADRDRMAQQLAAITAAHRDLREAQNQLVRAERLAVVGQLAAGLAHEVGNPLAVVRGFVDILQEDDLAPADRARALQRMTRELDRIQSTLRELLDFSRAPQGSAGAGDVTEALQHVQALLAPQDRWRQIELTVQLPGSARPVALTTDAVTQVLLNLCLNAGDAVNGAGKVALAAEANDDGLCLTVDDDGPGVPADLGAKIFAPFFTSKEPGRGTGLGLAVCVQILDAVGGRIEVGESAWGGARFTVWIPYASAQQALESTPAGEA